MTEDLLGRLAALSPVKRALVEQRLAGRQLGADPVAVVGIGCRFPGAEGGPEAFWRLLRDGADAVTTVPAERWDAEAYYSLDPAEPGKANSRWGGFLDGVDLFDARFFGLSPAEAVRIDPQHRLLLEVAREALEDAGLAPDRLAGSSTGVFVGIFMDDYRRLQLSDPRTIDAYVAPGSIACMAANRVSHLLDLRGPSMALDTACSSSLLAVHLACRSLQAGECELALAGGVNLILSPYATIEMAKGGFLSPAGRCKAFDASADGYVRSEGVGVVVLKPLARALADRDPIYALIRGSAVNQDGRSNGLTAPSRGAQEAVLREACRRAGWLPGSIQYVETHGAGTPLGDAIEAAALGTVLAEGRDPGRPLAIGSVKTNIGHAETAAGIAGFIKTVLALQAREVPASLHCEQPNPQIPFDRLGLRVQREPGPWPAAEGEAARAGVSAFGFGGTNVHVLLEEAPRPERGIERGPEHGTGRPWHLLLLSARSEDALQTAGADLARHLAAHPGISLGDAAYTSQVGRSRLEHRRAVVCRDREGAVDALEGRDARVVASHFGTAGERPVAFLLPGVGDHYPQMARGLYDGEPVFRSWLDRCAEALAPHLGRDLRDLLYAGPPPEDQTAVAALDLRGLLRRGGERDGGPARLELMRTEVAQPVLFAVEYALARLLMAWGVQPRALAGYSLGEYVASCLAGVFPLEDALALVAGRARRIAQLPSGAMLAVPLGEAEVAPWLGSDLALAAVNGPAMCVVAGEVPAVAALEERLAASGVLSSRLPTSHAFHSPCMEPLAAPLAELVRSLRPRPPRIPFLSNVTGTWITGEEATDPSYWARHLCGTVRFADAAAVLLREPRALVEVGPGALGSFVRQHPDCGGEAARFVLPALRHEADRQADGAVLLRTLGHLWLAGAEVDWEAYQQGRGCRRLRLPATPFDRQSFWYRSDGGDLPRDGRRFVESREAGEPERRPDAGRWFYAPSWRPSPFPATGAAAGAADGAGGGSARWLVFAEPGEAVGRRLLERLAAAGETVLAVRWGARRERLGPREHAVAPGSADDYAAVLREAGAGPVRIVHLWSLAPGAAGAAAFDRAQERGFYSLLALAKALARREGGEPAEVFVVSRLAQCVTGAEALRPEWATLLGLCSVVPQEVPGVGCRLIDLDDPAPGSWREEALADRLAEEVLAGAAEPVLAYRGGQRWVRRFEPLPAGETAGKTAGALRHRGVYLITGGLGAMGLALAEHFGRTAQARLVLVGRTELPPRGEWDAWLASRREADPASRKIRGIRAVEAAGGEVLPLAADVADRGQMARVLEAALARFGDLHGVVHAAGLAGQEALRAVEDLGPADCEAHFRAKARALPVLEEVLGDRRLDFVLLQSSISAVLGGLGFAAYAAANAYMSAFACRHGLEHPVRWVCVDWDGWAVDERSGAGARIERFDMSREEALEAFQRALALGGLPHVVNSLGDLEERVERWLRRRPAAGPQAGEPAVKRHARPRVSTAYAAPATPLERTIAEIWQDLLRIEEVGADDSFFELGGQSLLAAQFFARLRRTAEVPAGLSMSGLFEAPTPAAFARFVSALANADDVAEPIRPLPRDGELPLSYNQQQLWLLAQLEPDSPLYNETAALALRGALDAGVLRRSLDEIVRRHEVLRTTFVAPAGRPVQAIAPHRRTPLPQADLAGLPARRREAEVARLGAAEARRPFDLARGPLLRPLLLRSAPREHCLLLGFHHLVHDGESMKILGRELAAIYEAFSLGRPSPLPGPPVQYADYAGWQRERLAGGEPLETSFAYWREQLAGSEPVLDLALDRPRPPQPSHRGAREALALPGALAESLRALAAAEGATPFMVLLAAFFTLLHRYSGQDRINVGNPRSARDRAEVEGLLGFVVDTRVLSADHAGDPPWRDLLRQVRERVLGAEAHADLPFELLVERLQPERIPGVNPLFQAMFAYQQDPRQAIRLPGLELSVADLHSGTAKFDLDLSLVEANSGIEGFLEYATDLFEAATARLLLTHFRRLLEAVVATPERRLWDLPLLGREEVEQILAGGDERGGVWAGRCLHRLVEEQAARAPGAAAVSAVDGELTYGELDALANRLAHGFAARGLRPGGLAAVLVERGLLQAPVLLAVLKAGGAFVCLDPRSPQARLEAILAETLPPVLAIESAARGALAPLAARHRAATGAPLELLEVDRLEEEWPARRPEVPASPSDRCYVAYTSGSTGKPKGIVQSHAAFTQFLGWQGERFGLRAPARIAQWAALSYDAAYCEIFGALCGGATLCVPAAEVKADGRALLAWLRRERVSLLQVVPSFCRELLRAVEEVRGEARPGDLLPDLEQVLLAGEALPVDLARSWLAAFGPRPALFNLYGPSETVLATWYAVREVAPGRASIPVGRAIGGRHILVLDRAGRPCPPGIRGEIHVRSRYLAQGYLERPEETRAAFLQNPLHGDFPDPVYRTGDLGRWLSGGDLEFCGRRDHQVKIRGMRVELGEVEAALAALPGVRECAVRVHELGESDRRLVAYLTVSPAPSEAAPSERVPSEEALRRLLGERLPEPMVPSSFVVLAALPRTATGKLDRNRLPLPDLRRTSGEYLPPRSPLEEQIVSCWRELLGVDRVGAHDNFFALGGNSLSAVRAMHRLAELCGVELPARALWEAPTPAALAARIEAARETSPASAELLRDLLDRVQQLSEAEVEALLAGHSGSPEEPVEGPCGVTH